MGRGGISLNLEFFKGPINMLALISIKDLKKPVKTVFLLSTIDLMIFVNQKRVILNGKIKGIRMENP